MTHLLTNLLLSGLAISTLVFLWFSTTFVLEYGSLFGLSGILKEKEWKAYNLEFSGQGKYPYFLRERYSNFGTRLLGCPYCLITFLSLLSSVWITWGAWQGFGSFVEGVLDKAGVGIAIHLLFMLLCKNVYSEK